MFSPQRRRHCGLPSAWAFTRHNRVWCPVRQNDETRSIHWRNPGNALNVRTACILTEKTKNREFIRRPTEPHVCAPPGDAAIAACQARVRDTLDSAQLRDTSFC